MHIPGIRSYSDLVNDWSDSVCAHPLKLKSLSKAAHTILHSWLITRSNAHDTWQPCCSSWTSNDGQKEDKELSQYSHVCHQGEFRHVSISAWWQSWQCSQKFHRPFLRAELQTYLEAGYLSNGGWREDKSTHNSTTKVSFSTKMHMFWSTFESNHDGTGIVRIFVGHC